MDTRRPSACLLLTFGLMVFESTRADPLANAQSAPSPKAAAATAVVPFTIHIPDAALRDLKQRVSQSRFADELPDANWDYGTNVAYLKSLMAHWRDRYDWRAHERRLNQFNQFITTIDGVDIHFIHQRSKNPAAMPLLLLNGWPSSIVEYVKVIGPLTDPVATGGQVEDSFHVVVPSMPGYGFSGKPRERGYNPERMARIWVQLMARLGYSRYAIHGSDWGTLIAARVAFNDSTHVSALHLTNCAGGVRPAATTAGGQQPLPPGINRAVNSAHNLGYQEIQSTKPQTLGHGLSDSPLGLASWIIEKWYGWSDHDGDLEQIYSKDDLLTNIAIYWLTNSGTSSARIYYENRHVNGVLSSTTIPRANDRVTVPTGCGVFRRQYDGRANRPLAGTPEAREAAEARYHVVHFATMPRGGHFPALEQPALWLDDIRRFLHDRR